MSTLYMTPASRKASAAELAALLSSGAAGRDEVNRLLQLLGYMTSPVGTGSDKQEYRQNGHVGIYQAELVDGNIHYRRDVALKHLWSFYANIPVIYPKGNKKRVVLLGESAARGFLLDPDYTPAFVLGTLLARNIDVFESEVIDLAETNLGMAGLKKRYLESYSLHPDMIVILAGNNWRADLVDFISTNPLRLEQLGEAMAAADGIGGIKESIENMFGEIVSSFLKEVGELSGIRQVPVIFVIPEFNLLDFQSSPGERAVTRLANGNIRKWIKARDLAENALAENDCATLGIQAGTMIFLDPSNPLGYELMARARLLQERYDEARGFLEEARDTALYCRTNSKPRIFNVIRDTIRKEAADHGIHVIDLPDTFKTYLKGKIPGREIFLDYCHFTIEGIQVVAETIARKIVTLLTGQDAELNSSARSIKASPETTAMGHLFAAIHNAHWGQAQEILNYHCLLAAKFSSDTHRIMIYYIDMISRNSSNTLCSAFQKLLDFNKMDKYVHALIPPRNLKFMEVALVQAMVSALKYSGIDASSYANDIRQLEHSVNHRKINLLAPYYHSTSYDEYEGTKKVFFQARDTSSRFIVIAKKDTEMQVDVTWRIPEAADPQSEVILYVNDAVVEKIKVNNTWQSFSIRIPARLVVDGINRIAIAWPMPAQDHPGSAKQVPAVNRQSKGKSLLDIAYYVFGEIYSLHARPVNPGGLS